MKINRRSAIGATIGGIAAGPEIMQQAVNQGMDIGQKAPSPASQMEKAYMGIGDTIEKQSYISERINKLKSIIGGDLTKLETWEFSQLNNISKEHKFIQQINNLKSISPQHKEQMLINYKKKKLIEYYIEQAKNELNSLLGMESLK